MRKINIFAPFKGSHLKKHASQTLSRGGSRTAATSKVELFVVIVNSF